MSLFALRKNPRRVVIYALVDPRNGTIRYVGRTRDPRKRLMSHMSVPKLDNPRRHGWVNRLRTRGMLPTLIELESCPLTRAPAAEAKWIARFRPLGTLYNGERGTTKLQRQMSITGRAEWYQ